MSERHIRRFVHAGSLLKKPEVEALRAAPRQVGVMDLIGVGKIGEAEERGFVVRSLSAGEAKTVKAARKAYAAAIGKSSAPPSDRDQKLARLADAWARAGGANRLKFVADHAAEIEAILTALDRGEDAA